MDIEVLWKKYQKAIRAFLMSRLKNPDDVDGLLQDIFVKALKNLPTMKSPHCIKPWLFRITYHSLMDFYRKKPLPHTAFLIESSTDDSLLSTQDMLSHCVIPFIQHFSKENAELLMAIDIQKIPQKHYAQTIGVNYSTLKSRVQNSRRQLRQLLEACCDFSFDRQGHIIDFQPQSTHCTDCTAC